MKSVFSAVCVDSALVWTHLNYSAVSVLPQRPLVRALPWSASMADNILCMSLLFYTI